jgi:hypothetical protein
MELVGALALTVTGIALATMTPAQLRALRPERRSSGDEKKEEKKPEPEPDADPEPDSGPEPAERRRQRRAGRTRQRR